MSNPRIIALYAFYEQSIRELNPTFTTHEFILKLAHSHQREYVEALYAYRDHRHHGRSAPFQIVHDALAKHLATCEDLVSLIRADEPSTDLFGQPNPCALWRNLTRPDPA